MSLGYVGYCKIIQSDVNKIVYGYTCENWNHPLNCKMDTNYLSGIIEIDRRVFNSPYIETRSRLVNKTKSIKIYREYGASSVDGMMNVIHSHMLDTTDNTIAHKLFFKIVNKFVESGNIPEEEYLIM